MPEKSQERTSLQILKHPLLILLLGTLLGSVIVPYISGRSARAREIEELRVTSAVAAVQNGNDVDRRLNGLLTTFESFWKDTPEAERAARKGELRSKIYSLYEEFDHTAWWWFDESRHQARLLGLLSEKEAIEAEALSSQYRHGLEEGVAAIDSAWQISLRQSPPPNDAEAAKVLTHARKRLDETRMERYLILEKFTRLLCRRYQP